MLKVGVMIFFCVIIAIFFLPSESFCVQHVALEESFNNNQENQNLLWPWFTDVRNGIRWHYNAMPPHFRAEPEFTPFSWGVQDFIFNRNVIADDEFNLSAWCAYTNRDNVNAPRWPEDDFYVRNQNAWMWWGEFELIDAIDGTVSFWLYLEMEENAGDVLSVVAFTDEELITSQGEEFSENVPVGISVTADNGQWQRYEFNLDELILNGDEDNPVTVLGEEEVYLAFVWQTDDSDVNGNRGAFIDDVTLVWDDGLGPQEIAVDRDAIDFGRVHIFDEQEADEILTITNIGGEDLLIENIETDNEVFTVDFNDEIVLESEESVEIMVTFAPPRGQFYEGLLAITSDDPENEVLEVNLAGAGGNEALEVVNPLDDVFINEDSGLVEIAIWDEVFRGDLVGIFFEGDPEELNMEFFRGVLSINPEENFNIPDGVEITLIAMDAFGQEIEDVFIITIAPVNDAPEVVEPIWDCRFQEDIGLALIADLDEVFFDVDGDELEFSFDGDVEELNMGINEDNILFIDAEMDFILNDGVDITVVAEDPDGETAEDVFNLVIPGGGQWEPNPIDDIDVNEDPGRVEIADLAEVFEGFDDDDELMYTFRGAPNELNMGIDEENTLFFNPDLNFNLPDGAEITVSAENPNGESVDDVFWLVIIPVNDPPEVVEPIEDIVIEEDEGLVLIDDLDEKFFDVDGDELTFSFEGDMEELNMGINDENILFVDADMNFILNDGVDITVVAEDPDGETVENTFNLVIPGGGQWEPNPIDDIVVDEDPGRVEVADLNWVFNDEDEDFVFFIGDAPAELNMEIDENANLFFNPDLNYNTPNWEEIIVFAEDGRGEICAVSFGIRIRPVNDPPEVVGEIEDIVIVENADRTEIADLDEIFFDIDGDEFDYSFIDALEELRMNVDDDNILSVFPIQDFFLEDPVEITVVGTDEGEETAETSFLLMVNPEELEVEINPIEDVEYPEDIGITTVADLEEVFVPNIWNIGARYSFEGADEELNMQFGMDIDRLYILPERNYNNPDGNVITVFADFGEGNIYQDEFLLTILPVNDPPHLIEPLEIAVLELNLGRQLVAELDDVFGDIDGDQLEYSFEGAPDELNMSINDQNRLLIDPERDFANHAGFLITLTATDPEGESVSDDFRLLLVDGEFFELNRYGDFIENDLSMELIVEELRLIDQFAPVGWEIGIFTPGGVLSGGDVWFWDRLRITIYGDDPQTEEIEGFREGERLEFRVWDNQAEVEYEAEPERWVFRWSEDRVGRTNLEVDIRHIIIGLTEGWNMISTNVLPPDDMLNEDGQGDIILMTEQLRVNGNNHHVEILKDEIGRFYAPEWNFNNIPFWDVTRGYQARVDSDVEIVYTGEAIPADEDIPLTDGWNIIAYFPHYELDASEPEYRVLSPIIRNVIMAKNSAGQFMIPRFGFSNMPPWRETQGYQVKVDADVVLNYPPEQEEFVFAMNAEKKQSQFSEHQKRLLHFVRNDRTRGKNGSAVRLRNMSDSESAVRCPHLTDAGNLTTARLSCKGRNPERPTTNHESRVIGNDQSRISHNCQVRAPDNTLGLFHFVCNNRTGENMSVLITSFFGTEISTGSEIAAFNSDAKVVGSGIVNNKGQCGLAVWGDDSSTDFIDGMRKDEAFSLKLWDVRQDREFDLTLVRTSEGEGLVYQTDGLSVLDMEVEAVVPNEFFISEPYPNPFNSTVRLDFGLPEASLIVIKVYDIGGRLITTLSNDMLEAGLHLITWNAKSIGNGTYVIKLSKGEFTYVRKLTLLK